MRKGEVMRAIDGDALGLTDMEIIMCNGNYKEALKMLLDKIDHAPTIEPERKTGKWVRDPKSNRWRCSECCSFALRTDYREECLSDYCSVCGAYMKGEPNE